MLPPAAAPALLFGALALALDDDFLLALLLHAARTAGAAANPATPAIPFSTERRLGGAEASGAGVVSLSRMAASIAGSNSFPRNPSRAITAKSGAQRMSTLRPSHFGSTGARVCQAPASSVFGLRPRRCAPTEPNTPEQGTRERHVPGQVPTGARGHRRRAAGPAGPARSAPSVARDSSRSAAPLGEMR